MYRFFVEEKEENYFILSDEVKNHLKSIRLKNDEHFLCNYQNEFYECKISEDKNKAIILKKTNINNELDFQITLYAAIINIKRFEWLIQKAAELGVKKFYPLITKNTNIKYVEQVNKKIKRFHEISKNACEQSFRNYIMEICEPISFSQAIKSDIKNKYIAHEKSSNIDNFFIDHDAAIYVGPEGGFDQMEIEQAKDMKVVSLGKKILRAETASIFILSRVKV